MAKDGKKKTKLPKQIAGIKIPKDVRKGGERLIAQAQSPEGRAAIAKGVTLVAGAATAMAQAAAIKKQAAADASSAKPGDATSVHADPHAPPHPNPLGDAIGAGVDAVLGRLFAKRQD